MQLKKRTPCVGICSTTYGDLVCRGCKRFAHEIVQWNGYDDVQQDAVRDRLQRVRDEVLALLLVCHDEGRLQSALRRRRKAVTFVLLSPTDVSAPPTGWEERGDARCRPTSHLDEVEEALLHHVKQARTSTLHSAQAPAGSLEMKCEVCDVPGGRRRSRA